jgi:phage terminase large subunit GpA-like protein
MPSIQRDPIAVADLIPGAHMPPERLPIMGWIARHLRMPEAGEGNGARLSFATRPYQPPILEAIDNPAIDEVVLVAFSQGGKSTLITAALGHWICNAPGNILHVSPIEDSRDRYINERLAPFIRASPTWRRELIGGKRAIKSAGVRFAKARLYTAVAQSEAQLASVTCRYVMLDEVGKFPLKTRREGSPIDQARKRLRTQRRRGAKLVMVSTPTMVNDPIWTEFRRSDMRRWHVPCPACGKPDRWDHRNLRWPEPETRADGSKETLRDIANRIRGGELKAWYKFPCCGAEIHTREAKLRCNLAGRFVANGTAARVAGFHVPSFASDDTSFDDLAAAYAFALHEQRYGNLEVMRIFMNHEMGLPYIPPKPKADEVEIAARVVSTPRGAVPAGFSIITIGADLQHDRLYWLAMAWKTGEHIAGHVVDWGQIEGRPEETLPAFAGIYARPWMMGERPIPTTAAGIDSGDGPLTGLVYTACLRTGPRCYPVKGDNRQLQGGALMRKNEDARADHRGRLTLVCPVNVNDRVLSMSDGPPPAFPGESYGLTYAAAAADDATLQRQLASWERREDGTWAKREGYSDDHYHDCRRYAVAMAARLGLFRAALAPQKQDAPPVARPAGREVQGSFRDRARGSDRR